MLEHNQKLLNKMKRGLLIGQERSALWFRHKMNYYELLSALQLVNIIKLWASVKQSTGWPNTFNIKH